MGAQHASPGMAASWVFLRCRLAAQLARTEEAAKRLMVRSDRSARGGAAARLLAAEKELCRVTADATEAHSMSLLTSSVMGTTLVEGGVPCQDPLYQEQIVPE